RSQLALRPHRPFFLRPSIRAAVSVFIFVSIIIYNRMNPTRRDFIKTTAVSTAVLAASPQLAVEVIGQTIAAPSADPAAVTLGMQALDAARSAGARYSDVRIGRYRQQRIDTRERQVRGVSDTESY